MYNYTVCGAEVDRAIEPILKQVVDEILQELPKVTSILLTGGFGRGEGSVKIDDNEKVIPLKDFDFLIFFDTDVPFERIRRLENKLRTKFRGEISLDPYPYNSFTVDLNATTLNRCNLLEDIVTYEAKVASHLMYGKDIKNKILITKKDVPLRSGARILFQKGISLVGQFSTEYLYNQRIPEDKKDMFIYECAKVFVELGTSLSILGNVYEPSYKKRASLFRSQYETLFPDLYEQIPELGKKIAYYTDYKLNPNAYEIKEDPISLWFAAREYHKNVLKYYMIKYLNVVDADDYQVFCFRVRERLKHEYYKKLISHVIFSKYKIKAKGGLLSMLNAAFQLYGNLHYTRNITQNGKYSVSLKSKDFCCPTLNFFYATQLILQSINKDGFINVEDLDLAKDAIKLKPKCNAHSNNELWEHARQACLDSLSFLPYMY